MNSHPMRRRSLSTILIAAAILACPQAASANERPKPGPNPPARALAAPGTLPLTHFYDTPIPLRAGKPGDLIRSEPSDEYDLPMDASALRILYRSVSATGEDVAASGVVLFPDRTPPSGGWPVIAWAHPFLATARACAPSLLQALHSGPLFGMYLNLGYAVVAADYVGLGTAYRNAAMDLPSNATDVIDSVTAARHALPQLSPKWVAIGDADGGAVALMVAELEASISMRDPGYLGSVAVSNALDLTESIDQLSKGEWNDRLAFLAYGIKTVYPQFQPEDILTAKGLERYRIANQSCSEPSAEKTPALGEMLKPDWKSNAFLHNFLARNTLAHMPASEPVLVMSTKISTRDAKGADSTAAQVVARMCGVKDRVDFQSYPTPGEGSLMGVSVASQISWINSRFTGKTAPNNCP